MNTDYVPCFVARRDAEDVGISETVFLPSRSPHLAGQTVMETAKLVRCDKDTACALCSWEGLSSAVGGQCVGWEGELQKTGMILLREISSSTTARHESSF